MNARALTVEQIRVRGLKALSDELGPVGLVRLLQQFESRVGDYATERHSWLGDVTVDSMVQELQNKRKPAAREA
jgi:hypothetical protein